MARIPDPVYDYEVNALVRVLKRALLDITDELARLDLADFSRANAKAALASVAKTLAGLNDEAAAWVEKYVPRAAIDGVARAIVDLGVASTLSEAETVAKFNRINKDMVAAAVADTQADVLAVTQNIDRKVRAAIRQVSGDSLRANLARGTNGARTISRETLAGMRKTLGDAVNTGIIDAAGRRWNPQVYVDMLTRTKLAQTHREATINEAVGRGALYARISSHGAVDACRNYEGTIVKLTPEAPGDYKYVGDLPRREIFHPNCRHVLSPIRDPKLLEEA